MIDDHLQQTSLQSAQDAEFDGPCATKNVTNAIPFAQRLSCTVPEACAATGLGRTKLYELIGADALETTLVGRRRLVSVKSLLHLIGPAQTKQSPSDRA